MGKCIRCGKPCADNVSMCPECQAWFDEKTKGSSISGAGNVTLVHTPKEKKETPAKPVNQGTPVKKNQGPVIRMNKKIIVIAGAVVLVLAILGVILLKGGNKGNENVDSDPYLGYEEETDYSDDYVEDEYSDDYVEDDYVEDDYAEDEYSDEDEDEYDGEYILPGSDSRYLDKSDLRGLSAEECRLARNELYARHGRIFNDEELQDYFNSKSWYYPSIEADDFEESMLNDYEVANRDLIVEYEEEQGYR